MQLEAYFGQGSSERSARLLNGTSSSKTWLARRVVDIIPVLV